MSGKKAFILFTLLRVLFFAVPFAIFLLFLPAELRVGLNLPIILAAVFSAMISFALSVLTLSKLRAQMISGIAAWRTSSHTSDNEAEDAIISEQNSNVSQETFAAKAETSQQNQAQAQ